MSKIPLYFFSLFFFFFLFIFLFFFFLFFFLFPSPILFFSPPLSPYPIGLPLSLSDPIGSLSPSSLSPSLPAGAAPSPPPASGRPLPSPRSGRGGGGGAGGGVVAVVEETFPRASKAAALTSPALVGASSPSAPSQLRPTPGRRVPPCTGGVEAQAAPPHPRVAAHRCPVAKCL